MRFARFAGLAAFASLIFAAPLAADAQPARQPHRPRGRRRGARNVASISTCRPGRSTIVHADFGRSGTRA